MDVPKISKMDHPPSLFDTFIQKRVGAAARSISHNWQKKYNHLKTLCNNMQSFLESHKLAESFKTSYDFKLNKFATSQQPPSPPLPHVIDSPIAVKSPPPVASLPPAVVAPLQLKPAVDPILPTNCSHIKWHVNSLEECILSFLEYPEDSVLGNTEFISKVVDYCNTNKLIIPAILVPHLPSTPSYKTPQKSGPVPDIVPSQQESPMPMSRILVDHDEPSSEDELNSFSTSTVDDDNPHSAPNQTFGTYLITQIVPTSQTPYIPDQPFIWPVSISDATPHSKYVAVSMRSSPCPPNDIHAMFTLEQHDRFCDHCEVRHDRLLICSRCFLLLCFDCFSENHYLKQHPSPPVDPSDSPPLSSSGSFEGDYGDDPDYLHLVEQYGNL